MEFIPGRTYSARMPGYVFKKGFKGLVAADACEQSNRRGRDDLDADTGVTSGLPIQQLHKRKSDVFDDDDGNDGNDADNIASNGNVELGNYDDFGFREVVSPFQTIARLKSCKKANQLSRVKYFDTPEKFMESEFDLHAAFEAFHALVTSPNLNHTYSLLVEQGMYSVLEELLVHENPDVAISCVRLLQELTDPSTIRLHGQREEEDVVIEVESLVLDPILNDSDCISALVAILPQLGEATDVTATATHSVLGIVDNLLDLAPDRTAALLLVKGRSLLPWILRRILKKEKRDGKERAEDGPDGQDDEIQYYAVEVLSVMLQADLDVAVALGETVLGELGPAYTGIDALLQCARDCRNAMDVGVSLATRECITNIYLCLSASMTDSGCQDHFQRAGGFQQMLKCIHDRTFAASGAVTTIRHAVSRHSSNARALVASGGLRYIFPLLLGYGLPQTQEREENGVYPWNEMKKNHHKRSYSKKKRSKLKIEVAVVAILSELCLLLCGGGGGSSSSSEGGRVISKLLESEGEKALKCVSLFVNFAQKLESTDDQLHQLAENIDRGGASEEEKSEFFDSEFQMARRLEGGLAVMQDAATVVACSVGWGSKEVRDTIGEALKREGLDYMTLLGVLLEARQYVALTVSSAEEPRLRTLDNWCRVLSQASAE